MPAADSERERARRASVVVVHERYREAGGEDRVFEAEVALLREHGHRVATFTADNAEITGIGAAAAAAEALWNPAAARALRALVRRERADVVHLHNTFPLLSASLYGAAHREGAAVVQTLHNFRLVCPNALLFGRDGPCERCVGKAFGWPGVLRGCYRGSRAATTAAAASAAVHRRAGRRGVDLYLALSDASRERFVAGGLDPRRVSVRPNFLPADPGAGTHADGFALYAGRLSAEKGVETLLRAWGQMGGAIPLKVAGTGPLAGSGAMPGVELLGALEHGDVLRLMREARFLVFPSECHENFPLAVVEAFATGLPVLVADGGAAAALVRRHAAGLVFARGDAGALAAAVCDALARAPELSAKGAAGREAFLAHYTAARGYESLIDGYETALRHAAASVARRRSRAPGD